MRCAAVCLLLAAAVGLAAAVALAAAQGGPPKAHPRPEDIPYIKCQVRCLETPCLHTSSFSC